MREEFGRRPAIKCSYFVPFRDDEALSAREAEEDATSPE